MSYRTINIIKTLPLSLVHICIFVVIFGVLYCNDLTCFRSGIYMSEFLHNLANHDCRVCPMVFSVRLWARTQGITQAQPGVWLSNFQLTMLVIHFLQERAVLPLLGEAKSSGKSGTFVVSFEFFPFHF